MSWRRNPPFCGFFRRSSTRLQLTITQHQLFVYFFSHLKSKELKSSVQKVYVGSFKKYFGGLVILFYFHPDNWFSHHCIFNVRIFQNPAAFVWAAQTFRLKTTEKGFTETKDKPSANDSFSLVKDCGLGCLISCAAQEILYRNNQ